MTERIDPLPDRHDAPSGGDPYYGRTFAEIANELLALLRVAEGDQDIDTIPQDSRTELAREVGTLPADTAAALDRSNKIWSGPLEDQRRNRQQHFGNE